MGTSFRYGIGLIYYNIYILKVNFTLSIKYTMIFTNCRIMITEILVVVDALGEVSVEESSLHPQQQSPEFLEVDCLGCPIIKSPRSGGFLFILFAVSSTETIVFL